MLTVRTSPRSEILVEVDMTTAALWANTTFGESGCVRIVYVVTTIDVQTFVAGRRYVVAEGHLPTCWAREESCRVICSVRVDFAARRLFAIAGWCLSPRPAV